jgi:pyruvate dehydrogenase E1 component beta subunit
MNALSRSVARTGRIVVSDTGHSQFGVAAEVIAAITERCFADLRCAPRRVGLPHVPTPTTPSLAEVYYPRALQIAQEAAEMFGAADRLPQAEAASAASWHDVPDPSFTGPY